MQLFVGKDAEVLRNHVFEQYGPVDKTEYLTSSFGRGLHPYSVWWEVNLDLLKDCIKALCGTN